MRSEQRAKAVGASLRLLPLYFEDSRGLTRADRIALPLTSCAAGRVGPARYRGTSATVARLVQTTVYNDSVVRVKHTKARAYMRPDANYETCDGPLGRL